MADGNGRPVMVVNAQEAEFLVLYSRLAEVQKAALVKAIEEEVQGHKNAMQHVCAQENANG